jgi:hypothetical protein
MSMMNKKHAQRKKIIMLENIPTIPSYYPPQSQQPNVLKPTSSTSKYPSDNTGHQPVKKNQMQHIGRIVVSDSESDDNESNTLALPRELEARLMKHQLEGVQWLHGTFQRKTGNVQ